MKKHIRLVLWATILGGIASLWILVQAQAQSNEQGGGELTPLHFIFLIRPIFSMTSLKRRYRMPLQTVLPR
ncbi:MAG: hypothetical protein Fur0044_27150 [Anaerolineae bacterium]